MSYLPTLKKIAAVYRARDDFNYGEIHATKIVSCDRTWQTTGVNGGAHTFNAGSATEPGKLRHTVTAVGDIILLAQQNWYATGDNYDVEAGISISAAPDGTDDYDFGFGFFEGGTTVGGGNGVYFAIDRTYDTTNILACAVNGGSVTRTSTGVTIASIVGTQKKFRIIKRGTSNAYFYIDDVLVATISANLGGAVSEGRFSCGLEKIAGSNARYADVDFIEFEREFATAR
jgi:hypothetical protein